AGTSALPIPHLEKEHLMDDHSPLEHRSRRSSVAAILAAAAAVACAAAVVTAALTPTAVASAAPSPAAASSVDGAHHGVTVLRFAVKFSPFHVVDVPPLAKHAGDYGIGDYAVFSDQLLNSRG